MVLNYFFDDTKVCFDIQLLEHIKEKNDEKVESIMQNAKDLYKAVDNSGASLLHYAAELGNETTASYLIKLGSKVNLQNNDGNTPLLLATKGQHFSTIKLLLESDADMYICNNQDINSLQMALNLSPINVEIAKLFLDQLTSDCSSDSAEIAKTLMKINCPFYVAVLVKDEAVLRYMLSGCWPINAKDPSSGKTALHVAVENLDSELVQLLLHFGADVNATDALNRTPLAMLDSCDEEAMCILQDLIDAQPNVTLCDDDGLMQMHWILKNGTLEAVEKVLTYRFDMSTTDEHKRNILHYLAKNIDLDVVNLVYNMDIVEKVNLNARDEDGSTPLHYAMDAGNAEFVWKFDEKSAKNIANNKGVTPFLQAIESTSVPTAYAKSKRQERSDCVKILLMDGANPDILLGQYFKIYNTKSAIKRDFDLLKHVVAMLVICKADGQTINQDVLDRIETCTQLKEYFDSCAIVAEKLKSDKIYGNLSLFDCVTGKKKEYFFKVFSSILQYAGIRSRIKKYESIKIYYSLLREYALDTSAFFLIQIWRLLGALYSFMFYKLFCLWYNNDEDDDDDDDNLCLSNDDCLLLYDDDDEAWYHSDLYLIPAFIIFTFVLFSLYDHRKHVKPFFKKIFKTLISLFGL